jgi:serine/threonine-protein kinase
VTVFDVEEDERGPFIVMELVSGEALDSLLRREGHLEAGRVVEIGHAIADTIAVAHEAGIVHRDLKPGNIMVTSPKEVKVLDFGIARALSWTPLTSRKVIQGTAEYLSPEQARGETLDGRSDVYSLGVMLYEMLTGAPPFTCDSPLAILLKHLQERPADPRTIDRSIPKGLSDVVMRCLEKAPGDRYASARDLRDALATCGAEWTPAATATTRMETRAPTFRYGRFRKPHAKLRRVAILSVLLLGAIAAGNFVPNLFDRASATTTKEPIKTVAAPTGLHLTSACDGFVGTKTALSWVPVTEANVIGYEVYRGTGNEPYEKVSVLTGREQASFADNNLETDTTYHYKLRSVAPGRDGDFSQSVSIGTPILCLW